MAPSSPGSQLWMQPREFVSREKQRLVIWAKDIHNPDTVGVASSVYARQPRLRHSCAIRYSVSARGRAKRPRHRRLMRRRPHSLPHTPLEVANAGDVEDRKRAMPRWTRCISRDVVSYRRKVDFLMGTSRGACGLTCQRAPKRFASGRVSTLALRPSKSSDSICPSMIMPSHSHLAEAKAAPWRRQCAPCTPRCYRTAV